MYGRTKEKWIWHDEDECFFACSRCGYKAYGNTGEVIAGAWNYCPQCGAEMEAEEGEEGEEGEEK